MKPTVASTVFRILFGLIQGGVAGFLCNSLTVGFIVFWLSLIHLELLERQSTQP